MRISIHTLGTRGDVQPFLSLALELRARGHDVQIVGPSQFAAFVSEHRIAFAPLPGEFLDLLNSPAASQAIGGRKGFSGGLRLLKYFRPLMKRLMDDELAADRDFSPDIILYHPKALAAPHIAEALGAPCILASPLPGFTATAAFPTPLLPFANLGPLNRASHALATRSSDVLFGRAISKWREETLNISPRRRSPGPNGTLYAYSPHVLPVPADYGADVVVSGYWFLDDDDWIPPAALTDFLTNSSPPIYIGFGSMPGIEPAALSRMFIEAVRSAGVRAVLAIGGGALAPTDAGTDIHVIDQAPHHRLFPHMAAIVHHGGAGTTGAALRAGKPMVMMPFFGDQPFWARRMQALGVAPAPLDRNHLTAERIAAAITSASRPEHTQRAGELEARISAEDGPGAAADFIERIATMPQEHRPSRGKVEPRDNHVGGGLL